VDLLLKAGANVELADDRGWRPVHWASQLNRADGLARLLAAQANPSPDCEEAPLVFVARLGYVRCLELLLNAGASVDQPDRSGRTALHLVSWFGHPEAAKVLLSHNASCVAQDETQHTPLHYAAWFGQVEISKQLIDAKAPIDACDHSQKTPLHFAVQHRHLEVVRLLLSEGANWRLKDSDGKTPEGIAIAEGASDILDILTNFARSSEEPATLIDELIKEHKQIKDNLEILAKARDQFLEPFNTMSGRIEGIQSQIQRLVEQQDELAAAVTRVKSVLKDISAIVTVPEPKPDVTKTEPKPEQPKVHVCNLCSQNPSAWRCKVCHKTFCKGCWNKIKPGKCPFCKTEGK
jgi:ankyrin repeat protein